ncbi:transmembrane protease serine 11E-like isoform X2 [Sceloporus undulatus]|uniref:transmembrane protease serine 11E-like isoform X2 n=1 Tax=Sceloporus undulatus TaxID=8520 RepID=UPI001C4D3C77|nr:transmembrane protease serine 11E-like isoform X2 [Sceloporus undulatus]XP_042298482.1 transmembrane protease serine 11E-like isoform X2 [Sceloporus undulatus]XP_042298483.1 transmembrane protease serine 11E-like isoform X2 [Sceloporus undulatus]
MRWTNPKQAAFCPCKVFLADAAGCSTTRHKARMGQVNYQKPKRRSLRCCYCCVECLSGFLVLMSVATVITLLRYFLEFSGLSFTNGGNGTEVFSDLGPTQGPTRRFLETVAQTKAMDESPSQQILDRLMSTSPQSSPQRKMDAPQPSSQPTEMQQPISPYLTSALSQPSPPSTTEQKSSLFSSATSSFPTDVATSMASPLTVDTMQTSSGWATLATKLSLSSRPTTDIQETSPSEATPSVQWSLSSHLPTTVNLTGAKPGSPEDPIMGSPSPNVTSQQLPFSVTSPVDGNETNQYFHGSFQLPKEVYHSSYSNHTSEGFRSEALKLENMIDNMFAKSALKHQYRKSFIQGLEPRPFRAKFLLKFSDDDHRLKLDPETVVREMVRGYEETQDKVAVDVNSILVEDYKELCLTKPTSLLSPLLGANHKPNSHWDAKHLSHAEDWPWVASVMKEDISVCDGTLITDNWVLTARNCVASGIPSLYTVKLAPYAKHTPSESLHSVGKIVHPSGMPKDLALLQLAKPVPATSSVHPICLPDPSHIAPSGTECWALGSKEKHTDKPEVLQWTVTSQTECQTSSPSHSTCAETTDLKKHLQLSTGGPFLCLGENQQVYLEGIVPVSAESQGKKKEQSAAFPRMAPWVPWIKSQLSPDKAA